MNQEDISIVASALSFAHLCSDADGTPMNLAQQVAVANAWNRITAKPEEDSAPVTEDDE